MSKKRYWTKFFWEDWENDPALRLCSLAAQGLWMRMLCIAAKADPCGYVMVNGRPLDAEALARLTGETEATVERLLSELADNGVFSRDRKGRIYSRRMVRDYRRVQTARRNGKKGGNPSLCKNRRNPMSDNPQDKPPDKLQDAKMPDARSPSVLPGGSTSPPPRARRGHTGDGSMQAGGNGPPSDGCRFEASEHAGQVPASWRQWAVDRGLSAEKAELEAKKFASYWRSATGPRAVKADWRAAWEYWIFREVEEQGSVSDERQGERRQGGAAGGAAQGGVAIDSVLDTVATAGGGQGADADPEAPGAARAAHHAG